MESAQLEDYNWKFPNRDSTMYLSTISKVQKRPASSYVKKTLDVSDIDGAQPKYLTRKPIHKESYANRNNDIEGAQTKIAKILNVEDRRLKNDDIDGTLPVKKFKTTRTTNPLEPHYQLPVVEYIPYQTPHFIRDSINADDIQGTKTKPTKIIRNYTKEQIKQKAKPVIHGQNTLNVKDINLYRMKHVSERETNPLEPVYRVINQDNKAAQIGQIEKSKPKISQKYITPDFMNNIGDIEGTWSVRFFNKHLTFNKEGQLPEYKQSNYTKDIAGTQVSSKKKGITSNRVTNPLSPNYQYIGHAQNSQKQVIHQRPKTAAQKLDRFVS